MSTKSEDTDLDYTDKEDITYIEGKRRSLFVKIDLKILPWLCAVGFFQFLDKVSLTYASVLGIITETHLQGAQYGALGSLFYVGYLVMQIPNSYMMQRFPLTKLVGTIVFIWGGIIALTALGKNFSELAGLIFLLGFFEACVNPNFMLLTSLFYRKQEVASRLGAWWLVNGLCSAFGGLIGYGIGHMEGDQGIHSWQWLMIILGSITSCPGIGVFFFLIDDPRSPRLHLTEEEKVIMEGLNAILLGIPAGVVDVLVSLLAGWIHGRTGDSLYTAASFIFAATVGLFFLLTLPTAGKLVGLYLVTSYIGAYVLFLSSITANTSGYTKKILTNAIVLIGYTIGNIIGPLIMTSNQAPLYVGGMVGCISANAVTIVIFIAIRMWMSRMKQEQGFESSSKDRRR
ncbi:major facilitator superfamily domain-containing protein [Umbelopsis sp. PMI_123]|nr:major facilitator superfamily domain-containing protein [Umbelopsis sp. PMI_123]